MPPVPDLLALTEANFLRLFGMFLLALVRVGAFFINLPAFGEGVVLQRAKAALAALTALLLLPHLARTQQLPDLPVFGYGLVVVREMAIGLTLGFLVLMAIDALKFAGEVIGMQIGFAYVQVVDPESNREMAVLSEILQVVGVLTFLAVNGHLLVLQAFAESFRLVGFGGMQLPGPLVAAVGHGVSRLVFIGLQLAMPAIAVIVIGDVALGIIARTVPRMNIFEVGFPLKIFLGMVVVILMVPRLDPIVRGLLEWAHGQFGLFLRLMGAG